MEPARADREGRADEPKSKGIDSTTPAAKSGTKSSKRIKLSMDVGKKEAAVRRIPSGVASNASRRGSISMLAHQLRMLEAQKEGEVRSKEKAQYLQPVLDSWAFLGFTAVASTAALLLAVLRTSGSHEWHASNGLWGAQLLLAVTAALELGLRLYACGPSYCADWVCLCDTFVIVGGVCLTASLKSGSAALFLRTVRIAALGHGWCTAGSREAPEDNADKNPAVQLYKLVMRAVRDSNVFNVAEKKTLRRLLSLLAHQQIYVDITLQRGNEDYWKEYGHGQDKPRGRFSFAASPDTGSFGCPSNTWASPLPSPLSAASIHGLTAKPGNGHVRGASGLEQDDAVGAVLAKVDQWDFDPFELEEVTQGHPLVALSTYLFTVKYNLFACFPFSKPHFTNFMVQVEQGYGSGKDPGETNIYHNRRHATDVTQAVHYFLKMCNLGEHLEDVEVAALLLGALIHDFKHPGRSNAFLTKTGHSLALTYNDVSVLENFHLSEAFFLLKKNECNFFRDLAPAAAQELRQIMVSMVLATDLKQHFDVLGEFNSHLADVNEGVLVDEGRSKTYTCAMKVCIKSADISHPARETGLHLRWTRDIIQEFFLQGDEEKSLGLEPSPLCDRDNTDIASSQKNFIGFLVKPLYTSWVSFLDCPAAELCTANLKANEAMWVAKEKVGDNSLDAVDVPVPATPPASPLLRSKSRNRRSSLVKAIQMFRSGPTPGSGEGFEQGGGDDGRTNRSESKGTARAGTTAGGGTPPSTSGEGGTSTNSYKTLEEGRVRRKQDDESSTELLIGVGPFGSGATTDADAAEAATEAAAEAARYTTTPRGRRGDDISEVDSSRDSSSRSRPRQTSSLEKIFSSSTDLSL